MQKNFSCNCLKGVDTKRAEENQPFFLLDQSMIKNVHLMLYQKMTITYVVYMFSHQYIDDRKEVTMKRV